MSDRSKKLRKNPRSVSAVCTREKRKVSRARHNLMWNDRARLFFFLINKYVIQVTTDKTAAQTPGRERSNKVKLEIYSRLTLDHFFAAAAASFHPLRLNDAISNSLSMLRHLLKSFGTITAKREKKVSHSHVSDAIFYTAHSGV